MLCLLLTKLLAVVFKPVQHQGLVHSHESLRLHLTQSTSQPSHVICVGYIKDFPMIQDGRSFMATRNSKGPRIGPCGTPAFSSTNTERSSSANTCWDWSLRYDSSNWALSLVVSTPPQLLQKNFMRHCVKSLWQITVNGINNIQVQLRWGGLSAVEGEGVSEC